MDLDEQLFQDRKKTGWNKIKFQMHNYIMYPELMYIVE